MLPRSCVQGKLIPSVMRPTGSATEAAHRAHFPDGALVPHWRFASVSHLLRLRAAVRLGLGKDGLLSHRHGRPGFEATFAVD